MANDQDTFHADLCELLTILGMGDHSRPQSPHEVFQEALGVLRERLSLPAPTAPSPCLGEREAVARTERPGFNFIDLELRCDERADMPEEISPDTLRESAAAIRQLRRERHELEAEGTRLRTEKENLLAELGRALERTEQAEEDASDARYKADCAEEDECDALGRAEKAEEKLITLRAERDAARELAYELKLAAAGGEDVPGSAHAITVEDVARWRDEAWTRTAALDRDVAKARRALALTLRFVDRAAGEGITFLEGDNGKPAQDAADICFAVADIFVIEDLDSDEYRALTNPEPPHGD